MVEFSIIFCIVISLNISLSEIRKLPCVLKIMPADENKTSQVEKIQFEHLYYYRITKDIISHIVPEIQSEFGELIQFKYADPLYMFHFRPIDYGVV